MALWWLVSLYLYLCLRNDKKLIEMAAKDLATGGLGIGSVELVPIVTELISTPTPDLVQIIVQVVIGVVTLIRLLKGKGNAGK